MALGALTAPLAQASGPSLHGPSMQLDSPGGRAEQEQATTHMLLVIVRTRSSHMSLKCSAGTSNSPDKSGEVLFFRRVRWVGSKAGTRYKRWVRAATVCVRGRRRRRDACTQHEIATK